MKKSILIFVVALGSAFGVMAQGSLDKGKVQLNAGFGFSSFGVPIYAGLDFGVHEAITTGL